MIKTHRVRKQRRKIIERQALELKNKLVRLDFCMPLHLNKLNFMVELEEKMCLCLLEKITLCAVTVSTKCPDNGADIGFVSRPHH